MKNLKIMSKMLGGLLVLGILAACSKADNEVTPDLSRVPTHIKVDYKATVSQQLLDAATVVVRYINEDGHTAVEQITSTTWAKSVIISLPGKAGMNIVPTPKSGVSEGEYILEAKGEMTYSWLENGQLIRTYRVDSTDGGRVLCRQCWYIPPCHCLQVSGGPCLYHRLYRQQCHHQHGYY